MEDEVKGSEGGAHSHSALERKVAKAQGVSKSAAREQLRKESEKYSKDSKEMARRPGESPSEHIERTNKLMPEPIRSVLNKPSEKSMSPAQVAAMKARK